MEEYFLPEHHQGDCQLIAALLAEKQPVESLLGREGQAAREITPEMMSHVFAKSVNNTDPEHGHIYDHRIAAAELNRMLASQPSPSTPIVPGTAGLSAADVANVLVEMTDSIYWKQSLVDGNMNRLTDRLNALLASKPGEDVFETNRKLRFALDTAKAEFTEFRKEVKQREAKIRKSVLEEAARECEQWAREMFTYEEDIQRAFKEGCTDCASRIRALAERPAPAGEVKGEK